MNLVDYHAGGGGGRASYCLIIYYIQRGGGKNFQKHFHEGYNQARTTMTDGDDYSMDIS